MIHERDRRTDGQTSGQTHTAWWHRPRLCIASCSKKFEDMLSHFHLIPERYGQTDRRTDRFAISISRVSMLMHDKNCPILMKFGSQDRIPIKMSHFSKIQNFSNTRQQLSAVSKYTMSQKTGPFHLSISLQILTEFNNSFTTAERNYLPTNTSLNFPLNLVCSCTTLKNG